VFARLKKAALEIMPGAASREACECELYDAIDLMLLCRDCQGQDLGQTIQ